ncbi:MAG: secretin and TonB N-terminal domain-containing protein [candidate division Zixibacteria bacterium]|nr:secretin and TonB N-terminal domain-containing protein [candidate division Zixibacteria bacterium]
MKKWIKITACLGIFLLLPFSWGISQPDQVIKNLSLKDAEIHSVLNFLAEYGKVNIVTSPNVDAEVTLNLNNVSWKQALDIVLKTYQLAGIQEDNYIRVLPLAEYLTEQSAMAKHSAEQMALAGAEMRVIRVFQATASNLVNPVKTVLSERGTVDTDDRTNSLIIRDIPSNIDKAETLVKELDRPVEQIRISSQLLEVDTESLTEFGLDWSVMSNSWGGNNYTASGDLTVDGDRVAGPGGTFTFSTFQKDFDLITTISALASNNKLKIVAHPEITTIDNTEARIQMGEKVPIKQFDQSGNVVITFVDVGTILKVTPHITAENRILMKLEPERSQTKIDPLGVIIQTVNASTNVVVENGQTVVIGGLTTQEEDRLTTGIPILKDIPLLGALFSYNRKSIRNKDLVIFVTPTIVEGEMHGSVSDSQPKTSNE